MNEYLAAYLLLGLPMSIVATKVLFSKWVALIFIYPLWPLWNIAAVIYAVMPKKDLLCGYCGKPLPPDKAVIMAHVQKCDKNPLVLRVRELETQLAGCLDTIIPQVAEIDKLVREEKSE